MDMSRCIRFLALFFTLICASNAVTVTLEKSGNVDKEATTGDASVLLSCSISGSNNINMEWGYASTPSEGATLLFYQNEILSKNSRNGRILHVSPYSLQILNVIPSDAGFYTCDATDVNTTPNRDSNYYNLTILVPPSTPKCGFPSDYAITLGQSTSFSCSADGIPDPTYSWYKNGVKLPPNPSGNALYTNTSYTYNTISGKLSFSNVVAGDAGTYYCQALNKAGSSQCDAHSITTKTVNVGKIVGIVFGVIFAILLLAVLVWWTWKRGYCDGIFEGKEHDMDNSMDEDGANDIVLDGAGPLVHKAPSENGKQEASMMI